MYLNNYFRVHVCLSFRQSVSPSHFQISLRLEVQRPSQTAAEQGEAELCILDFKTTWSEFQKPSQTAAERGGAELRILDFKTTWSEFLRPCQTATEQGKLRQVWPWPWPWLNSRPKNWPLLWTKLSSSLWPWLYPSTIPNPKSQLWILTLFKYKSSLTLWNKGEWKPPQNRSKAVVCVSTPRMYPRSGYFLVYVLNAGKNGKLQTSHAFISKW